MAEKSAEAGHSAAPTPTQESSGNWWDNWITSAKTKSAEVYTMVKKDLDEIGSAVKCEASHVFSTTSNVIGKTLKLDVPESPANAMKKSFSTFIGQVNTVLNPEPDDEDDTEVILSSGDTTMLSTYRKELEALQRVDATFIVPADSPEFEAWRNSLEKESGVISPSSALRRMDDNPALKTQYNKLVPDAVGHNEFWERYLFRVALLQDRLAAASRKIPQETPSTDPVLANLPMQASIQNPIVSSPKKVLSGLEDEESPAVTPDLPVIDHSVVWDDEDFANDVELTEEQQILLLEEYEKEIASKKVTRQTSSRDIANNNADKTTNTDKQTRDKMNNKPVKKAPSIDKKVPATNKKEPAVNKKGPVNKAVKKMPATENRNKKDTSLKKGAKTDVCGNNLVEDYFGEKDQVKDDASANSDESWEKEFEIEDVQKA